MFACLLAGWLVGWVVGWLVGWLCVQVLGLGFGLGMGFGWCRFARLSLYVSLAACVRVCVHVQLSTMCVCDAVYACFVLWRQRVQFHKVLN